MEADGFAEVDTIAVRVGVIRCAAGQGQLVSDRMKDGSPTMKEEDIEEDDLPMGSRERAPDDDFINHGQHPDSPFEMASGIDPGDHNTPIESASYQYSKYVDQRAGFNA